MTHFTARVGEKLWRDRLAASVVTVFVETNRLPQDERQYTNAATHELAYPTDATSELLHVTLRTTERIYKCGYKYKKAGVMLAGLVPTVPLTERMYGTMPPKAHGAHGYRKRLMPLTVALVRASSASAQIR